MIKTLTGNVWHIDIDLNKTVKDVKLEIQTIKNIPVYQQRICCNATILSDDIKLSDVCVDNSTVLHLIMNIRGGGFSFADLNYKNLKEYEPSPEAPEYRMYNDGLNFEAKCENDKCLVYEEFFIVNIGYGIINIKEFVNNKIKCPLCELFYEPITCGFNNCEFRIDYVVNENDDISTVETKYKQIGKDVYSKFEVDIKLNKIHNYDKAIITVRKIDNHFVQSRKSGASITKVGFEEFKEFKKNYSDELSGFNKLKLEDDSLISFD